MSEHHDSPPCQAECPEPQEPAAEAQASAARNVLSVRKRRPSDKELAKYGLMAALGVLTVTGFSRKRGARRLHVLAGGLFIGLSVWHHLLYSPCGGAERGATRKQDEDA